MSSHANPVNWFEIPATDLGRAKKFYEAVLGVEIAETVMGDNKMGFFPMELDAFGAAGALVEGPAYTPSHEGSLVYFHVGAINPKLAAIDDAGGKLLVPRTSIGPHGFIAHFEDTEGNRVALHEKAAA